MPRDDEHAHQVALFAWAKRAMRQYPQLRWLAAIPNGGARAARTAGRLAAEGVRRGVPDMVLAWPAGGYHGLWIELKRPGRHSVSAEQREWIEHLASVGYRAEIVAGWDAARELIVDYLTGDPA